jgi:LacI family transcriptional regulator
MASMKDVARRAGVSIASVSRVLNASFPVTDQMREAVYAAVKELDYRVDKRARSLRRQRSGTLALIVSEVGNPFFPGVLYSIERAADEAGYSLFICNADENERRQELYIESMLDQHIEGVIVMPVSADPAALEPLVRTQTPTVLLDRVVALPVADAVLLDNEAAAELAIAHLYELGHRLIAMVMVEGNPPADQRLKGARLAAAARGCEIGPVIDYVGELKESGGYAQMQAILAAPVRPSAVLFVNNPMAIGGLAALRDNDVRLPGDMSAVSFDDVSWARLLEPPLTTVMQPLNDIGRTAMELLLDRIEGRFAGRPREVRLPGTLLVRESTGPAPR